MGSVIDATLKVVFYISLISHHVILMLLSLALGCRDGRYESVGLRRFLCQARQSLHGLAL